MLELIQRRRIDVGVHELGTGEPLRLLDQCRHVDVADEQGEDHRVGVDRLPEPVDPFVGDPEVDHLGSHSAGAGADRHAADPSDRTTEQQPEQTCPHRTTERRSARTRIPGLVDNGLALRVGGDEHRVTQPEAAVGGETCRGGQELLGVVHVGELDAHQRERGVVG